MMSTPPHRPCSFAKIATNLLLFFVTASHVYGADVAAIDAVIADDFDHLSGESEVTEQLTLPASPELTDRFWIINTRHLTANERCANLDHPNFAVFRVECNGRATQATFDEYIAAIGLGRDAVIYVHGNRLDAQDAIARGLAVYRRIGCYRKSGPIDWVMFSWPSDKEGMLIHDARRKAEKIDAQSLYLAWVLRKHVESSVHTALIGYSFGGRIVTGSLHALAGGKLGGRGLPGPAITGIPFDAGLVAPAIESSSMTHRGDHSLATKNLDRLFLLYNRRDAVLKRYWLIERVRGTMALGYSGPQAFAPRADGSKLRVQARDCSPSIGLRHDELDYYEKACRAGVDMAAMIDDIHITN